MKWVVYSSFDADGRSTPYAAEQVAAYRALGFEVLIVDTSPFLSDDRKRDWDAGATRWFQRPNVGHDFGSYRAGAEMLVNELGLAPQRLDLLLANDSCFGPFVPLGQVFSHFDEFDREEKRVFGITDSHQILVHLQSYWIYFRSNVTPLALEFLRNMTLAADREEAIRHGELAMSEYLRAQGCVLTAYAPVVEMVSSFAKFRGSLPSLLELGARRILKRPKYTLRGDTECLRHLLGLPDKLQYFNPSAAFGSHLYYQRTVPFIKKNLFKENVYNDPRIETLGDVATLSNSDVARYLVERRYRGIRSILR